MRPDTSGETGPDGAGRTERWKRLFAALVVGAFLTFGPRAQAQENAAPPASAPAEAAPKEEPLSAPKVAGMAMEVEGELQSLRDVAKPVPSVQKIRELLPDLEVKLRDAARETNQQMEGSESLAKLQDRQRHWQGQQRDLQVHDAVVTARAVEVSDALASLSKIQGEWKKRFEEASDKDVPEVVRTRIREVLNMAATAEHELNGTQASLLELQDRLTGSVKLTASVIEEIQQALDRSRSAVLGATAPPIWEIAWGSGANEDSMATRVREGLAGEQAVIQDYVIRRQEPVVVAGVFLIGLYALLLFLRPRARRQVEADGQAGAATNLLERPLSAAVVLTLLFFTIFNPDVPQAVNSLSGVLILIPLVFFAWPLMTSHSRPVLFCVVGFVAVDRLREVLQALPLAERLLFTTELALAACLLIWLIRGGRITTIAGASRWRRLIEIVQPVTLLLISLGLVATILGWLQLGSILGRNALRTTYNAFALWIVVQSATAILLVFLGSPWAQNLRVVRRHKAILRRRILIGIQLLALGIWLDRSLSFFSVREPVYDAVQTALSSPFEMGALSISLGSVLSFFVAILLAVYSSRFVKFVLDEEVMPRVRLPRGVPYAISTSARYVVLALGVAVAVSAAGIDLSKVTLLAGALGVGIGFGLQNVVGNFVSGLILLFERPIQTGDTISVGTLMGEVRYIGIRATTVRDFDGAEVIVPNANLLSEMVTNWTYSDRQRRMEVLVGVAYGTDPEQVIELMQQIVTGHEELLQEPPPIVHFMGFGDHSLDFRVRAWTDNFDDFWSIRSRLAIRINRAIIEAGIEIPFPQRDLHLRSVDAKISDSGSDSDGNDPE